MRPMAEYRSGRTYFTWVDGGWHVRVAYFDHTTNRVSAPVTLYTLPDNDGHRTPSMLIDDEGYIYVFYGSHGDDTLGKRTTNPLDITSWTACAPIVGSTTYPQPHQLEEDYVLVLHRLGRDLSVLRSNNKGASWFSQVKIVEAPAGPPTVGVYSISVSETGDFPRKLHVVWTTLNFSTQVRKHLWYAQTTDGLNWSRSNGTPYTLPIAAESAEKIFDSGTDQVNTQDIQLDSAGNVYVLVSHGENGGNDAALGGPWYFKLVKKVAGVWTDFSVGAVGDHQFDNGCLDIVADSDFRAYLPTAASQENEDGGNVEEWQSTDQGETWTKIATLTSDVLSHNGMKGVRNGQPEFRTFWSYGDSTGLSDVTMYFYGSGGGRTLGPGDVAP